MTSAAILPETMCPSKPLAGYEMIQRIGVGGYGEVWKARAPGGMLKAVKLIYGKFDEDRACRELKSLNRLSQVNHPFLLSIERIDVVEGQLIIVSELADGSVREEFERYRAAGRSGIPRDKVLGYLAEAAEALDFLYEKLTLQHLDVKPDNILLVGDHAKIADFGLVKSVHEGGASLVNGLTPTYASPDVFEGRPTRYSDQYSLAVMYQELVSGKLPFGGTSPAQLAAQHLRSEPDLSSLEPRDRFAVAKALSKDPERRFASCREFVARLAKHNSAKMVFATPDVREVPPSAAASRGDDVSAGHDGATLMVVKPKVEALDVPEVDAATVKYRPVLFLGLGGAGGDALRALRQLLTDRLPNAASIPSVSMLYVDTDVSAINAACKPDIEGALAERETLLLPLDSAQSYCSKPVGELSSLSRRWIYNMPKSQRTEGLRAVGRIALLDHSERVLDRLRQAIVSITERESLVASSKQTGLDFGDYNPRVFILASLGGGTGSGMLIDVAYGVRQVLAELGLCDDDMYGILSFGRARAATNRLAVANAYACLGELRHFASVHQQYPGEPQCGLAAFEDADGPFRHTYVVDLGMDLSQEQITQAMFRQAEYLYLSTLSPASALLDTCRAMHLPETDSSLSLRTYGIGVFGEFIDNQLPVLVQQLCHATIHRWRDGMDDSASNEAIRLTQFDRILEAPTSLQVRANYLEGMVSAKLREECLELEGLTECVSQLIQVRLNSAPVAYFHALIEEAMRKVAFTDPEEGWFRVRTVIDTVVGDCEYEGRENKAQVQSLRAGLYPNAVDKGQFIGRTIAEWALNLINDHHLRVGGARLVSNELTKQLEMLRASAVSRLRLATEQRDAFTGEIVLQISRSKGRKRHSARATTELAEQYAEMQVRVIVAEAVAMIVANVEGLQGRAMDELREYWSNLNRLAEQFNGDGQLHHDTSFHGHRNNKETMLSADVQKRHAECVDRFDRDLQATVFSSDVTLRSVLAQKGELLGSLVSAMRVVARKTISAMQRESSIVSWHNSENRGFSSEALTRLHKCSEDAQPGLLRLGGAKRTMALIPDGIDGEKLVEQLRRCGSDRPTPCRIGTSSIVLVNEGEQLSASRVLDALFRYDPQCAEVADRLHTRIDIDWHAGESAVS